jgi:hypothetical protein
MALMEYLRYTSALNGGFVGTEAQWIASLKGFTRIQEPAL